MSTPEFLRSFGTEGQCAEALRQARWPQGFRCRRCGGADHCVVGHGARKLFQCNGCRHQTSLSSGSLMEHTQLPLTTWFLAIYLISQAKTVSAITAQCCPPSQRNGVRNGVEYAVVVEAAVVASRTSFAPSGAAGA